MLRLSTFGGIALSEDSKPVVGAAGGQRRLALLSLLAESGDRGLDRDVVASLLWPDSEPDQGRHSLHQLLYAMRRAHGDDGLFVGTKALHLNRASITTDLWEFDSAVGHRHFEEAVVLYRGPFAAGFSLTGAAELERRFDVARSRYARAFGAAAEALATDAARRGDNARRARWWGVLADAEPVSTRVTAELIDALVAAGDRAQALQVALRHEALIRDEFGAPPDPEIVKRLLQLRSASLSIERADDRRTVHGPNQVYAANASADATAKDNVARISRATGGRYRLDRVVDDGTLTMSYHAFSDNGQTVEVHVVHPHLAATTDAKRFIDVFSKVTRIDSPHVQPVFDFGHRDDVFYFVADERVRPSLRDRLRQERELPISVAVGIARDVAAALSDAHAAGVRHGDLRPKHIGLTGSGARVGSFGVVDGVSPDADWRATSTIVTFGSPAYLSPEQLMGDVRVDVRSDLYSLGCVLYEMLAGEPPFGRPSRGSGLGRKLTQTPPRLRSLRESIPGDLDEVVHRCLARLPADRYASAAELVDSLTRIEAG